MQWILYSQLKTMFSENVNDIVIGSLDFKWKKDTKLYRQKRWRWHVPEHTCSIFKLFIKQSFSQNKQTNKPVSAVWSQFYIYIMDIIIIIWIKKENKYLKILIIIDSYLYIMQF